MDRPVVNRDSVSPSGAAVRRVEAHFDTWDQFLRARLDLDPAGLFVPGRFAVELGEELVLDCRVPDDRDGVRLACRVMWRRLTPGADASALPGLGLVLKSTAMSTFRKVVERAEGRTAPFARQEARFSMRRPVECTFGRQIPTVVPGEILDVSESGASVRAGHRPSVDDPIVLVVEEPTGPRPERGRVRWVRSGPRAANAPSVLGLRLEFATDEDRGAWERLVEEARSRRRMATEPPR
jgi:Tfp pilus assembly protein PilZ